MLFQGWLDSDLATRHVEYVKVRRATTADITLHIHYSLQVKAFKLTPHTPAVGDRAAVTTQVLPLSGVCDIMDVQ